MIDHILVIASMLAVILIPAYWLLIAVSEHNKVKDRIKKMEARHESERKEFAELKESVSAILNDNE